MTSAAHHRAQQARGAAAAVDAASDWLRRRAAQEMRGSRAAGEVRVAPWPGSSRPSPGASGSCPRTSPRGLRVAVAMDLAERPFEPRLPGAAT